MHVTELDPQILTARQFECHPAKLLPT